MSSASTNETSSEVLDLNAVSIGEDDAVVRVTESTVVITQSVDENLAEQVSDAQGSAQGTDPEDRTNDVEVPDEGRNLLETFARGSDVCDRSTGADDGVRGSTEEEASGDVGLIKVNSESVTKESVDEGGDSKLGCQPDVALTLKLGAFDAEELTDRGDATQVEYSATITESTSEVIHVASDERAAELENSEVLNSKGNVSEPMDLDENPSFSDKNQGLEVDRVCGGTEGVGAGDTDPSVSLISPSNCVQNTTSSTGQSDEYPSLAGIQELDAQIAETPSNRVIRASSVDLQLTQANADEGAAVAVNTTLAAEDIDESKAAVLDQSMDLCIAEANTGKGAAVTVNATLDTEAHDESKAAMSDQSMDFCLVEAHAEVRATVTVDTGTTEAIDESKANMLDQSMNLRLTEANTDEGAAVTVHTTRATEAIDESKAAELNQSMDLGLAEANVDAGAAVAVDTSLASESSDEPKAAMLDQIQGVDIQIAGSCGYHHEDQRMSSSSSELGASPLVDNRSMDIDFKIVAVEGRFKLRENLTPSSSEPIASGSDAVNLVVGLGSCPRTDLGKKVVEVLNEDQQTGLKGIDTDAHLTQPQSQPFRSDSDAANTVVDLGGCPCTDFEEIQNIEANATHHATDANQRTVSKFLKEDGGTAAKEMGDAVGNPGPDGTEILKDDGGNVAMEMEGTVNNLGTDGSELLKEDAGIVAEMGDNVIVPGIDGGQKTIDEVCEEERSLVTERLDDISCQDRDGGQDTAGKVFLDDEGAGVKEMADEVTHLGKNLEKMTADEVDFEVEKAKIREVGDGITSLGADGDMKAVDEIFQKNEKTDVKDGNLMILDDALEEGDGTEAKETANDVTHPISDQRNVGQVVKEEEGSGFNEKEEDTKYSVSDYLDEENLAKNVSRVGSHVNQMMETLEQVTTTSNAGTASVNDNQVFYGLPTEEVNFSVSDLVWGKVKSHPWWPGQIFDPSDASEQAMKYRKKDSFLIAYFGDRTFAWNEASLLKPFRTHFSQMEKQANVESFRKAVDCALDEVARRVELGLACSCTSEDIYSKTGFQMIENPGIRKEASMRKGVDDSFGASSFEPEILVEYIRALAMFPNAGVDRLEFVIAQVQLMAVHRSRGYSSLPTFQLCGSLVENEADNLTFAETEYSKAIAEESAPISENDDEVLSEEVKFKSRDGSFRKRKNTSEDGVHPFKKERSLSELMAGKKVMLADDGDESVDRKSLSVLGKKRKSGDSHADDSVIQNRKRGISLPGAADAEFVQPKRSFKVGESICRVASQLTGSSPILKCSSERLHKGAVKGDQNRENSIWDGDAVSPRIPEQRRKVILPTEHSSPEEMLSQLCLAARDPMKGYSFLTTIINFFSEFRNFVCLDSANSWKHKMSLEKMGGKKKKPPNSNMDSAESYSFEDMQDSYWTDRIVQIGPEEQPLEKSRKKRGRPRKKIFMLTNEADNSHQCIPALDIEQRNPDYYAEQPVEFSVGSVGANSKDHNSPSALILSFSEVDADSIPSEKNLNIMFKHFGPLREAETEVLKATNCARVVFKRHTDAEIALSSAVKFGIFGPMRVSYRLMSWPPTSAEDLAFFEMQFLEYEVALGMEGMTPQLAEDMAQGLEDMVPEGVEDADSQGIDDMDMGPLLIEDVASQGIENGESQGIEDMDMAPLFIEDVAPQGIEEGRTLQSIEEGRASQGIEDLESQGIKDLAPQGVEDMESQGIEDGAMQHRENGAPQGIDDEASQGLVDGAPQGIEDGLSRGMGDGASQGVADMESLGIEDGAMQHIDGAPQGIEDGAPQGMEDGVSRGMEDGASRGMEDGASQGIEDGELQGREDGTPLGTEDDAQHLTEDGAPQGIDGILPAGHNKELAPQAMEDMVPQCIEDVATAGGCTS